MTTLAVSLLAAGLVLAGIFIWSLDGARRPLVAHMAGPTCGIVSAIGIYLLVIARAFPT